jgi:cell division protein FtsL
MARNRKNQNQEMSLGTLLKAALICGVIVVSCVGYVWQKKQIDDLSQQIRSAEHRLKALQTGNDKLRKQQAALLSPPALEARVNELKLGLALPQPNQIWRLPEPAGEPAGATNHAQQFAAKKGAAEALP